MTLTSFAVTEIATTDERDYDNWLATLTQATERLDDLQVLVRELRRLCADRDSVSTREVFDLLAEHSAAGC